MRVKAVREHMNRYGLGEDGIDVLKKKGDEYSLADNHGQTLIDVGLVTEVKAKKTEGEAK